MSEKVRRNSSAPYLEEVAKNNNQKDNITELIVEFDEEYAEEDSVSGVSTTDLPTPPDGGWGWMVVFGSFMIHIIADGITYSFGIFVVELMEAFSEGRGSVSFIPSILVGVTLGVGPIASALTNRYGCRVVTILGACMATFGMAVSAAAPSILFLYLSVGVFTGIGFGFIYLPAIVSVSMYFERRRAFATGIAVCGSGLGTFIMAPVTRSLIDHFDWEGAFLVTAAIVFICVLFGLLFRPLKPNNIDSNKNNANNKMQNDRELLMFYSLDHDNQEKNRLDMGSDIEAPLINGKIALPDIQLNGEPLRPLAFQVGNDQPNGNVVGVNPGGMALSHPVISFNPLSNDKTAKFGSHSVIYEQKPTHQGSNNSDGHTHGHHHHHSGAGVMFRKDIFYGGSLFNIPEYKNNPKRYSKQVVKEQVKKQLLSEAEDHMVVIKDSLAASSSEKPIDSVNSLNNQAEGRCRSTSLTSSAVSAKIKVCGCVPVSSEGRETFKQMMDFSLFKNEIFIMFIVSNFLTSIGFNAPYVYTVDRALLINVDKEQASFLLSIIGIANTLARIVLGYLSDKPFINRLYLYNTSLAICGLAICLSNFCFTYATQVAYCALFGITSGAYVGLTSVVLVDLLGLDKLTNAFGLLLLFQGIASVMGPPIIGWLYDEFGNYDSGFYFAGSMIFISGVMLFFLPMMMRRQKKRLENAAADAAATAKSSPPVLKLNNGLIKEK